MVGFLNRVGSPIVRNWLVSRLEGLGIDKVMRENIHVRLKSVNLYSQLSNTSG